MLSHDMRLCCKRPAMSPGIKPFVCIMKLKYAFSGVALTCSKKRIGKCNQDEMQKTSHRMLCSKNITVLINHVKCTAT